MRMRALVLTMSIVHTGCTLIGLGVGSIATTTTVHEAPSPPQPPTPTPTLEQLKQCREALEAGENRDCLDPYALTGTPRPPPYVAPPPRVETTNHPWIGLLVGLGFDAVIITTAVLLPCRHGGCGPGH